MHFIPKTLRGSVIPLHVPHSTMAGAHFNAIAFGVPNPTFVPSYITHSDRDVFSGVQCLSYNK